MALTLLLRDVGDSGRGQVVSWLRLSGELREYDVVVEKVRAYLSNDMMVAKSEKRVDVVERFGKGYGNNGWNGSNQWSGNHG